MPSPQFSIRTLLWLALVSGLIMAFAFAMLRLMFLVNPILWGRSIDYAAGYSAIIIVIFAVGFGLWAFLDWRAHRRGG